MSDPQKYVMAGFIRSFKEIVDRVDPHDLVCELIQRRILPPSYIEQRLCEKREERMMRLLARVYRQSLVDQHTEKEFLCVLTQINAKDPGYRYGDIIEILSRTENDHYSYSYMPFSKIEKRVFDCTRTVAEKSLEPDSILPDLVSGGAISIDNCAEILGQNDRLEQVHCLMDTIQKRGSWALDAFVRILLESDDRSAIGVGNTIQTCLQTQRDSPYTPAEWLEHVPTKNQESAAFQRAYGEFFTHIIEHDPHLTIVNLLYSSDVLGKDKRDTILDTRQQRVDQIRALLRELEIMIERKPRVYKKLVSILKQVEKCNFSHLAWLLQKNYDDQLKEKKWVHKKCQSEVERDCSMPEIPSAMTDYQEQLRKYYSNMTKETLNDKWPGRFVEQVIPTNLAKITREKVYRSTADAFTQITLHGNIDEIDQSKVPISKECLFEEGSRCIVAQGAAGIGKSMFSRELAHDWAMKECMMENFQLLQVVPLRSTCFHNVNTVYDLLYPQPSKAVQQMIASSEGERLLLILDGFDELPEELQEKSSIFGHLISGSELPKARIIITSRPKAVKVIEHLIGSGCTLTMNVEILGFQLQNIESCVQHSLSDKTQQQAFLKYIGDNVVIKNMMYIPLHTAIVIELYKQELVSGTVDNCAMTLTQLFKDLCRCLLYRDISSKQLDDVPSFEELQLDFLPDSMQNLFIILSKKAFQSLAKQELIIELHPKMQFDHMGFMRSITVQSSRLFAHLHSSYSFHHLTIQEFLAAFYLWHTQEPFRQIEMIQELPVDHQSMVIRFLAGLSQFKKVGWAKAMESVGICLSSQEDGGCNSMLLNCLFEAQDAEACANVFQSDQNINYSPMTSTQFDYFALGYCIANSGQGCKWRLCAIGGEGLAAIASGISAVHGNPNGRIDLIKLSYRGDCVNNLGLLPECIIENIRELNLSNCGLNNEACMWLSKFLTSLSSLRQLDIGDNPFTGGSTANIFISLSKLNNFQYLDLLHAQLDEADIDALHSLVKKTGTLKNLIIGRCQMPPKLVEMMVDIVLADSSLENVSFMNIDFPRLATHLAKCLERNTTLESIMLWDRSFCTDGAVKLLCALGKNESLLSMTLMPWYKKNIPANILSQPAVESRLQWFIYPERRK